MKMMVFLAGAGVLAIGLSGCSPKLDQTGLSPEEQVWADYIKQNYSAWEPPVAEPRGVRGSELPASAPAAAPTAPAPLETAAPAVPQGAASDPGFYESGAGTATVNPPAPAAPASADAAVVNPPAPVDPAPKAAPAGEVEIYTVVKGDTLGAIAQKYYGRAADWKKIQEANSAVLKGKTVIRPGMKLTIPKP